MIKYTLVFYAHLIAFSACLGQENEFVKPLNPLDESQFEVQLADSFTVNEPKNGSTQIKFYTVPNWGDPGDFLKLEVTNANYSLSLSNLDGWVRFDQNYPVPSDLKDLNELAVDLALLISDETQSLLILFGWAYASEPGLCTVIDLSEGKIVYNQNAELKDIDLEKGTLTFTDNTTIECYGQIE